MKLSNIFFASVAFFFLFTAASTFNSSLFEKQGVQDQTAINIDREYDQLQNSVQGSNNSLQSKIAVLQTPDSGLFDQASAGLLLVPQFVDVLTAPMEILSSALDGIASTYPFIPSSVVTFLKILIVASIGFAVFSLAIGKNA